MKKWNIYLLSGLVFLMACDVLNPEPNNDIETGTPELNSRSGALALLNGAYDELQDNDVSENLMIMAAMQADLARWDGSFPAWSEIDKNNILSGNGIVDDFWDDVYDLVNVTNNIITNVPDIEDPEFGQAERDQVLAEALVLRAFANHLLVRWYSDVPIMLDPVNSKDEAFAQPSKSAVTEVYNQIFADLDRAEGLFSPAGSRPGATRLSYYGAVALSARAHLYFGNYLEANEQDGPPQYQLALDKAGEIISDGPYQIAADYNDVFGRVETDAQSSIESIWELAFTSADNNSMWFWGKSRREYLAETAFMEQVMQNPDDSRLPRLFEVRSNGDVMVNKYFRSDGSDNMIMFRLAETFLIRAEALGRLNFTSNRQAAIDDINVIRSRANIPGYQSGDINSLEDLIDAVLLERKVELAFEGHRWFDLVRTGRAVGTLGLSDANRTLWPLPAEEIEKNENLRPQNAGY